MHFYHKNFVLNLFSILFTKEQTNIWQSYFVLYLVSFAKYVLKKWEKAVSSNWTGIGPVEIWSEAPELWIYLNLERIWK